METLLKCGFEILITQSHGKSLSIEEELAMAGGFQQPSIHDASYNTIRFYMGWLSANIDFCAPYDVTIVEHDGTLLQRATWPYIGMDSFLGLPELDWVQNSALRAAGQRLLRNRQLGWGHQTRVPHPPSGAQGARPALR